MKRYTLLNEDFFDDNSIDVTQNMDDLESIEKDYDYTVIIGFGMSNYAATNENVFASVLKSFEKRVSAFFKCCRFIRDFSGFTYEQNRIKENESIPIYYGGYYITVDSWGFNDKNYINSLEISVGVNFNCKTARDCYKFIKFFCESKISNEYGHINDCLSILKRDSMDEYNFYVGPGAKYVDFTDWAKVADPTYELCLLMFGNDYKYGTMLKELHNDNFDRMCENHFFDTESLSYDDIQDRIVFVGRFEKINVCSLPNHWAHKSNTPYSAALGFYTTDGCCMKTMGPPWDSTTRYVTPQLKEFLENTPVYLYIVCTQVDASDVDEVIGIYEGTYELDGEEHVLALQTGHTYAEAALASFVSPEKAKELCEKYVHDPDYYETDDEDDEEDY